MEQILFNVMDYKEFDALVNENIPAANNKYEFVAYEEMGNDSDKAFINVEALNPDDNLAKTYDIPQIENGDLMYKASVILSYLCWKGIIAPGNYLIQVCW